MNLNNSAAHLSRCNGAWLVVIGNCTLTQDAGVHERVTCASSLKRAKTAGRELLEEYGFTQVRWTRTSNSWWVASAYWNEEW